MNNTRKKMRTREEIMENADHELYQSDRFRDRLALIVLLDIRDLLAHNSTIEEEATHYVDSRTPAEREADSKIKTTMTSTSTYPEITTNFVVEPSGRIDYCSTCGKDHGYDCPQETKESWADEFDFVDKLDRSQVINKVASLLHSERNAVLDEAGRYFENLPKGSQLSITSVVGCLKSLNK